MKIKVINKKDNLFLPNTVYIGRGSVLGNKFEIGKDGSREEVINKYWLWLEGKMKKKKKNGKVPREMSKLLKMAQNSKTLYLECYCAPKLCHGDIIRDMLLGMDK